MRVLVTGLNGFTGYYLQKELERYQHEVISLQSNLLDADAVLAEIKSHKFDAVAHLAGVAFIAHGNINDFYQVNLIGTLNLLEAIKQQAPDVQSILLASSSNIYGNATAGIISEHTAPDPVNDYAVSKFAMEKMALLRADKLPICIVRPFNYTGIGQSDHFVIPKIVKHFKERAAKIELGNLHVHREFNDVRMVVEIYRKLLSASSGGKILNICSGQGHSLQEVIKYCEDITGHKLTVSVNPKFVRENEVKSLIGDNSQLKKMIHSWQQITLPETLAWMLTGEENA